jgi:hypothetical protein
MIKELKERDFLSLIAFAFVLGMLTNAGIHWSKDKTRHEIIKTNIGEFILRDGKMYGVYELSRDNQGNMVAR